MLPPDKSNISNRRRIASPKDFYDDAEKLESDAEGHDTDGGTIENVGKSNGTHVVSLFIQYTKWGWVCTHPHHYSYAGCD